MPDFPHVISIRRGTRYPNGFVPARMAHDRIGGSSTLFDALIVSICSPLATARQQDRAVTTSGNDIAAIFYLTCTDRSRGRVDLSVRVWASRNFTPRLFSAPELARHIHNHPERSILWRSFLWATRQNRGCLFPDSILILLENQMSTWTPFGGSYQKSILVSMHGSSFSDPRSWRRVTRRLVRRLLTTLCPIEHRGSVGIFYSLLPTIHGSFGQTTDSIGFARLAHTLRSSAWNDFFGCKGIFGWSIFVRFCWRGPRW